MQKFAIRAGSTIKSPQFLRYAAVGVVNTLLDFALLNILISQFGWERIPANMVSTTVALCFSFALNSQAVFPGGSRSRLQQALLFISVTLFGLYGLQNFMIHLLTSTWDWPLGLIADFTNFNRDLIYTNFSKLAASAVTVVWNFVMYKKVVFANKESADEK